MPLALAAGLLALAFPPRAWLWPALVAPAIVGVVLTRAAACGVAWRGLAARAGAVAFLGYGGAMWWLWRGLSLVTPWAAAVWLAAALWVAALFAAAVGVGGTVLHRRWCWPTAAWLPVAWVAAEVLTERCGDLSFPWYPLGLAAAPWPTLAQAAELSGVHGLSAALALAAGLLGDAWLARKSVRRAVGLVGAAVGVVGALAGYGVWRERAVAAALRPVGRVVVVQPNMPQALKLAGGAEDAYVGVLTGLTRRAADAAAGPRSLVVWPETALDGLPQDHPAWADSVRVAARAANAPVLAGTPEVEPLPGGGFRLYNAARLTFPPARAGGAAAGPEQWYRKRRLVPVTERTPLLADAWEALYGGGSWGGFARGDSGAPLRLADGTRVGVALCFESVFPAAARDPRRFGADFLVVLTNDAWFGRSGAAAQHAAHASLRAIEGRVGVVQAANAGVSVYADPLGRAHGGTALFEAAAPTYAVQTTAVRTPYVRVGDWLGASAVLLVLAPCAAAARERFRR